MQPLEVVVGLLGEHRVAGALRTQPLEQQRVGVHVSGLAECVREVVAHVLAYREQQPAGFFGQLGGQLGVGETHPASIADDYIRCVCG